MSFIYRRWGDPDYPYNTPERLYGEGSSENLLWAFEIDWNGDGEFDGSSEARQVTSLHTRRGRRFYLKLNTEGEATGFQPISVGKCTFTLRNDDDRYNPWNSSSPLYPNISPGKDVRISLMNGYPGTLQTFFYGVIETITPISGKEPVVEIVCNGTLKFLAQQDTNIPVTQNITKSEAIDLVLDNISWPSRWGRNIESSFDNLSFYWANKRALSEINDLAEADLGVLFSNTSGQLVFYSRNHTAIPTLTLTQNDLLKKIGGPQPWENLRNKIRIQANGRKAQSTSDIWTLGEITPIVTGQEIELWAKYTYNNTPIPAINVLTPVITTDYTGNTQEDGGGVDITDDLVITEFEDFGKTALLKIRNDGVSGYLTLTKIRGDAITKVSSTYAETVVGAGNRLFTLDLPQLQNINQASDFSIWLSLILSEETIWPRIQLEARPDIQFDMDLFDVLNLTLSKLSLASTNFRVGYIEHQSLDSNLQSFLTTWHLEPFREISGFWTFPAQVGIETVYGL